MKENAENKDKQMKPENAEHPLFDKVLETFEGEIIRQERMMIPKGGMKNIIKKAQELQSQMEKAQEELNLIEIEGQAGGGMITAKVNGHKELITLDIEPDVLQEDKEMIEDLIVAAVNQALQNAGKATEEKMNSITGGLAGKIKLPGMV